MQPVWGAITAEQCCTSIGGVQMSGDPSTVLGGLSIDSRSINAGELFWALKGERYDGHDFVRQAVRQGAAGAVVEESFWQKQQDRKRNAEFGGDSAIVIVVRDSLESLGELAACWRKQHPVQVVAITGSAGKTTSKEMTAGILQLGHRTLKSPGSFNNLVGLPLTLARLENHRFAVLEMGMNRPGEIGRLTKIADPDVGVITNLGMAHLEGVGDLEGVAAAKLEMLEAISPLSRLVLNGDDAFLLQKAAVFRRDALTFGTGGQNDVRAANIENRGGQGISFELQYDNGAWPVSLAVPGRQNVFNALAAAGAALLLDRPVEQIVKGLQAFSGLSGRFKVSQLNRRILLVDDTYNANPSSLKTSLEALSGIRRPGAGIVVGLGEMLELGNHTAAAHMEAGRRVAELQPEYFLVLGDHAVEMIAGALKTGLPQDRVAEVKTPAEMQSSIESQLEPGALIFLKGSRKMGLEKVVQGLQKNVGLQGSNNPA